MASCTTIEGKKKKIFSSYTYAKDIATRFNKINEKKEYFYSVLRVYYCKIHKGYHLGKVSRIKKGKRLINLKVLGNIDLSVKPIPISTRKDIVIYLPKERFNKIQAEIKSKHYWSLTIDFKLKKIPKYIKSNSKVYIYNNETIKGYVKLIRIENNILKCNAVWYKHKESCKKFISFKYYKEM